MAEELQGTAFDKSKGEAGLSEVEELIRQTLEANKISEKPAGQSSIAKEPEFKATAFKAEQPIPPASEKNHPKTEAAPSQAAQNKPAPPAGKPRESSYDTTFKEYQVGDIVKGKILKIDPSGILVDIKYKADGLIPTEEISDRASGSPEEDLKVGDIIHVLIENLENKEGYAVLSKRKADYERKWKIANDAYRNKTLLEGKVIQSLRGGLVVDCEGIRGFIPASQVSRRPEETFESFVGKTIPVKVIDVNHRQGKIVLSHRLAAGEKDRQSTSKLFDELEAGQTRHGKVANLKNFGAFVDLGGVEGLIHLSELSWKRVKHPSEVLKTGDEIDVFVIGVDKTNKKVSLGLKELLPDPWVGAGELYRPGQVVKVKVLRFAKFGAFCELPQGLEGLIHLSELSKEPIQNPQDAILPGGNPIKIGDTVEVKILRVIPEEQKIGLSIRSLVIERERETLRAAQQTLADEKKITIADMIADKKLKKAEQAEIASDENEEIVT